VFNIVLFEPEIPANTGNIGRSCVLTGSRLHLVGPLGFSLDDHSLHRAGLGYWNSLDASCYTDWGDFLAKNNLVGKGCGPRLHLLTEKARKCYTDAHYTNGDFLVFGKESTGIPDEILAALPENCERIPMLPDAVSIRNANTWAAPRPTNDDAELQRKDICGNFINPKDFRISSLNLSNAVCIVLYEALRQTNFASIEIRNE
jgi:tRNA (cytidine/uridine-2'-O-)-methyltransferase